MKVLSLCLLLLVCVAAVAQQVPDAASSSHVASSRATAPAAAGHSTFGGDATFRNVADAKFWVVSGLMTGSTIAAAELAGECANQHHCDFMGPLSGRRKTYPIAMTGNLGMMALTYELKKHNKRYWFVPAVGSIAFTTVVAAHSANRMR